MIDQPTHLEEVQEVHKAQMGEASAERPHSPSGDCNESTCSSSTQNPTTMRLDDLSDDLLVRVLLAAGGAESAACLAATSRRFAPLSLDFTLWSAHARHVLAVRQQLMHASDAQRLGE